MDIRRIIADRMAECDVTQTALQQKSGVHQVRISDYLTGKRDINAETLRKIFEALKLEIRPARQRRRKGR